ncbi:MAG: UDP-N-acetylglucosamine 2-epimerase (non-hydrolyzing) [Anaerolineae bacterium]|nr:UDP-N-acetylglucosamine 2-epimerase (non-hydrolyzing) [Anaerolineae bacterium]
MGGAPRSNTTTATRSPAHSSRGLRKARSVICTVVGARPNFMKMAPVILELRRRGIPQVFVHTGQHYDARMSEIFFDQLGMPQPDVYLGVGSGSHADQTARIMTAFEKTCGDYAFKRLVVAGDVNSTLACALTAAKMGIPVAHVEAGLRSFDRDMPEEINRVLTDHLSDLLFTTEPSGAENLAREGISGDKVRYVGNSMIDSLRAHLDRALTQQPWTTYGFTPGSYGVVTLHRPSNVDTPETAREIAEAIGALGADLPLIFPIHPRTLSRGGDIWNGLGGVHIVDPLGYLEFLGLMARARLVITDSGGIQEETTALGVPCLTVRLNTERPVTLTEGTNRLVAPRRDVIVESARAVLNDPPRGRIPELWDGHAAVRIVDGLA